MIGAAMGSSDAMLCGRVTYEEWAASWSDSDEMAVYMNNTPKYVASTTLDEVEWQNSQQPGKDIVMSGSATLARSLLCQGLVDELRLMIHPVVVGAGAKLFANGDWHALERTDSTTFETGVVYRVKEAAPQALTS